MSDIPLGMKGKTIRLNDVALQPAVGPLKSKTKKSRKRKKKYCLEY